MGYQNLIRYRLSGLNDGRKNSATNKGFLSSLKTERLPQIGLSSTRDRQGSWLLLSLTQATSTDSRVIEGSLNNSAPRG